MEPLDILYKKWKSIQPLNERKQYLLSQRFTVEYNYNSNHIEGNTLTYGQTELLLLFGKVSGGGDLKDFVDMKASQVGLKMMEEEAVTLNEPLTQNFIRQLHKTIIREDYTVYRQLPGGQQTSYTIHAGMYKTRPNSVITRYGDRFDYASPEETPALMTDLFVDWVKEGKDLDDNRPHQYEFNKLNLNYTLMSKRNLLILVKEHLVNGWDDPRMPTLCGFRRRGYSPESIRKFVDKIGYTTYDALNDFALLESAVREDLNSRATRVSAVINPVKLIITNYPEGQVEEMEAVNNPEDPSAGTHTIEFSRELWIERDDFMEDAPKKYFRMTPGQEVRLKSGYIVKCTGCKKDDNGNVVEVYCEYDPDSKTGMPGSNRKIKGTIHWVSCAHCLPAEVRLYDRLWKVENPRDEMAAIREAKNCDALEAMKEMINPDSLNVLTNCYVEKYLADAKPLDYLQFQRIGYFNVDKDSTPEHLVFNRTVSLKDTWSKINK